MVLLSTLRRGAGSKLAPWVTTKGHFEYDLQRSMDMRYPAPPAAKYDTWARFFTHAWKDKYEIWPLLVFVGVACTGGLYTMYWSMAKPEVWLNRAHSDPPWDWSRCRENYWKANYARAIFDLDMLHKRIPIMEQLNDELLEAAIERGTRNPDGSTKRNTKPH